MYLLKYNPIQQFVKFMISSMSLSMYTISYTHGFPISKQLLDPVLRGYWEVHSQLTHSDDIISLDQRTVIPPETAETSLTAPSLCSSGHH